MDKVDFLILNELLKDAELSFVEIASRVHSTPATIRRRYERMKKEGTVFLCPVSINLAKLGYQGKALLLIRLMPNCNKLETIDYLIKVKNVMVVTETLGPYDILAMAPITDLKSIQLLVGEARKAPNVERVELSCMDSLCFPIGANFGKVLGDKSLTLAKNEKI